VKTLALAIAVLAGTPLWAQRDDPLSSLLRLKPGNYWVYRGTAESGTGPDSVHKFPVRWRIEILEETVHDELHAYLVRGGFLDLAWFEKGREPKEYLWISYRDRFYSLETNEDLLKRFRDPDASLLEQIETEQPLIQLPLRLGECAQPLRDSSQTKRDDLFYCWHFEEKSQSRLSATGLATRTGQAWQLWYRSMPDHQIIGFVPNVGFISYDFSHHGTPSAAHVKLIEAHLQ
jgi:hypothetical protein